MKKYANELPDINFIIIFALSSSFLETKLA